MLCTGGVRYLLRRPPPSDVPIPRRPDPGEFLVNGEPQRLQSRSLMSASADRALMKADPY